MRVTERKKYFLMACLLAVICSLGLVFAVRAQGVDLGLTKGVEQNIGLPATDIRLIAARIIRSALGLLGIVALVLVLYAGYEWMTAGGDEEKIAGAKKILINAVIGIAIILSAYSIVSFVIGRLLEATVGNEGGGNNNSGGPGGQLGGSIFYVVSRPANGEVCIQNVRLSVVFNRPVDVASLAGNLIVQKKDGAPSPGAWGYGNNKNTVIFNPEGACGDGKSNDCLEAKASYQLVFSGVDPLSKTSPIKSLAGELPLTCSYGAGCANVDFITGEGVDRLPPTIAIDFPGSASQLKQGDVVNARLSFNDDHGIQNISLFDSLGNNATGTGKFKAPISYPLPYYGVKKLASADFNGDGKLDIIVAGNGTSTVNSFFGNGDGTFNRKPLVLGFIPSGIGAADLNKDGRADLIFGNDRSIRVMLGNGDGTFKPPAAYADNSMAERIKIDDFNRDGFPDVVTTFSIYYINTISVFINNGDGTFKTEVSYPVGKDTDSIATGDLNGDGAVDLAVANDAAKAIDILKGNGDGTFQPAGQIPLGRKISGLELADLNGDKKLDIVNTHWTTIDDSLGVLLGNGDFTFKPEVNFRTSGIDPNQVLVADFNGDGKLDAAVSLYAGGVINIFIGKGDGGFFAPEAYQNPEVWMYEMAVEDFNGDGLPDIGTLTFPNVNATPSYLAIHLNERNGAAPNLALVASQSFSGCQASGTVNFLWPTNNTSAGFHTLEADALDWAAGRGIDFKVVNLKPQHCFDAILDANLGELKAGPPACGGECGSCGGQACVQDSDCAGSQCVFQPNQNKGVCLDRMRIENVSPSSGAVGSFVTISGYYFGDNNGQVYFSRVPNPQAGNNADWVEAKIVDCGGNFDNWTPAQIIVEVPAGSVDGPLKVVTAPIRLPSGALQQFTDLTNDNLLGKLLPDFRIVNNRAPGICGIRPNSGALGDRAVIIGKNFNTPNDQVSFGGVISVTDLSSWSESSFTATVPSSLDPGSVGVKVIASNGVESNGIQFAVTSLGAGDQPVISSITPSHGPAGEYLTITGSHFGANRGTVWFRKEINSPVLLGSFQFPAVCEANLWRDDRIIVKFPAQGGTLNASYLVQVKRGDAEGRVSQLNPGIAFIYQSGAPSPGICKINPVAGPVPFAPGASMNIEGEYFLEAGPLLRYSFDDGKIQNNTVADESGYGNDGMLVNGAIGDKQGKFNQALKLDGIDGYLRVKDADSLDFTKQFTLALWINTGANADQALISKDGVGGDLLGAYNLSVTQNFGVAYETNKAGKIATGNNALAPGQWNHLAAVFDEMASPNLKIYLNGVAIAAGTVAAPSPLATDLLIGRNGGGAYFNGQLDELRIYNRALPSNEIAALATTASLSSTALFSASSTAGGPPSLRDRLAVAPNDLLALDAGLLTVRPPLGAESGPVVVYRALDQKFSNALAFTKWDCLKNNNTCTQPDSRCCASGVQAGMCVSPANAVCAGETRSTGYVWRFATRDIPVMPRVIERCDEHTERGESLPSPSPSGQWDATSAGDHHNVCRSALVSVEIGAALEPKTIDASTVVVRPCGAVDQNNCLNPGGNVKLTNASYFPQPASVGPGQVRHDSLLLQPETTWKDATWYQVVLTKGIASVAGPGGAVSLAADRPCSYANSAYCFVFRADSVDCRLRAVVVIPYQYWTQALEAPIKNLIYHGNGLSAQRCIMMDVSGFSWDWDTSDKAYAEIYQPQANSQKQQVSALANTVAVGLKNDAVEIRATATTNTPVLLSKTGSGDLTIDLNNPAVIDYWPRCFESCTNAEVAVKFNTTMSLANIPGASDQGTVQLLICADDNCFSTSTAMAPRSVALDPLSSYTVLKIANSGQNTPELLPNTRYQVIISVSTTNLNAPNLLWSAASSINPNLKSKPYNKEFSWTFKTKTESCKIAKVQVLPEIFNAVTIADRSVFTAEPYSSPDSCSAVGQKLNPWRVGWSWSSADVKVAAVSNYVTKGRSPYCSAECVTSGSDFSSSVAAFAACGNGRLEAGEDCDPPAKANGCGLDCRFLGNASRLTCGDGVVDPNLGEACDPGNPATALGCGSDCRHLGSSQKNTGPNASFCGSGSIGSGEDCDLGIAPQLGNAQSALNCAANCLHTGTPLAKQWCVAQNQGKGGFSPEEFTAACRAATSRCGDGVTTLDEDSGCELGNGLGVAKWCTVNCLNKNISPQKNNLECDPDKDEGCSEQGQHVGSSLLYSVPSLCGDGIIDSGEDKVCENTLVITNVNNLIDPWTLAIGVGESSPGGVPPAQRTDIIAETKQNTKGGPVNGRGQFVISCGYQTDADCQKIDPDYGVGADSCCYARPQLSKVFPATSTPPQSDVCPNTLISASFDQTIDSASLNGNIVIARGVNNKKDGCFEDVTSLVRLYEPQIVRSPFIRLWRSVANFLRSLAGMPAAAVAYAEPKFWCAGADVGTAEVARPNPSLNRSIITISLARPLATNTPYAVVLKDALANTEGVKIGKTLNKDAAWKFSTAGSVCEIKSVKVQPPQWYFPRAGATTTLSVAAFAGSGQLVQPIPGFYSWEYLWGPRPNPYVIVSPTTSAKNEIAAINNNGEIDLRAAVSVVENVYGDKRGIVASGKSHVTVFLCEHPWPPKELKYQGQGPFAIFPYEDTVYNNDDFDLGALSFNNKSIPPTDPALAADGYFNFRTYYCADRGSHGEADDLPYLRPAVQTSTAALARKGICEEIGISCNQDSDCGDAKPLRCFHQRPLKRFILTNEQNNDVIGIQILENRRHLTAEEWYASDKQSGGQGFAGNVQHAVIDGYQAVTDEGRNNFYVDALNYASSTGRKNLFSAIYLFSINSNAKTETRGVFDKLMDNLKFNINLTNFGYCGPTLDNPGFERQCVSDLGCLNGQVCSAQIEKLKRNYLRLRDLRDIGGNLESYAGKNKSQYPELKEGTYLAGQTLSTWPSWSLLGNATGRDFPRDPINILGAAGTCASSSPLWADRQIYCLKDSDCGNKPGTKIPDTCRLHNSETGWSVEDRRFSFACASTSLAYRYFFSTSTGYRVRARVEATGLPIDNWSALVSDFVDPARFLISDSIGICEQDEEVTTLNPGTCGDKQLNPARGEQCDPPGQTRFDPCLNGERQVFACTALNQPKAGDPGCQWVPSSTPKVVCSFLSKCGNGLVEADEACDDGALNGRYNHCDTKCSGKALPYDPNNPSASVGFCGDGYVVPPFELCDIKAGLNGKAGWCLGGANIYQPCDNDGDCNTGFNTTYAGKCLKVETVRYAIKKKESCNFDCQSYRPYCGDGIVQDEFGEECDPAADNKCVLSGQAGARVCSADCRYQDNAAAGWWRFDDRRANQLSDVALFYDSTNKSIATCQPLSSCPAYEPAGKVNHAARLDGIDDSISVPDASYLMPTTTLSVEAWINPDDPQHQWQRVLEKGGWRSGGGYDLQFFDATRRISFLVFGPYDPLKGESLYNFLAFDSTRELEKNAWTHVVGTFEKQSDPKKGYLQIIKLYLNGQEEPVENGMVHVGSVAQAANVIVGQPPFLTASREPLLVGRGKQDSGYFFHGLLDEVKIYGRVLSAAEVQEHFVNSFPCAIPPAPPTNITIAGVCGDGVIQSTEACDGGIFNDKICSTSYGKSCTYCANLCQDLKTIQPVEYCGNGKVEGPEFCDALANGPIYSSATSTETEQIKDGDKGFKVLSCDDPSIQKQYTYAKGAKVCRDKCSAITSCTRCGLVNSGGVAVAGTVINALEPASINKFTSRAGDSIPYELFIWPTVDSARSVGRNFYENISIIDEPGREKDKSPIFPQKSSTYQLLSPDSNQSIQKIAAINSSPICSAGDPQYTMFINNGELSFDFDVVFDPNNTTPWKYDFVLSPAIDVNARPNDVRVVVSWVGDANLVAGFAVPGQPARTIENGSFSDIEYAVGNKYYESKDKEKVYFHGPGQTPGNLHELTFTVDTDWLTPPIYSFYVRSGDNGPISRYLNKANLKATVYLPEPAGREVGKPDRVFEFDLAGALINPEATNPAASYWQIFNLGSAHDIPKMPNPADRLFEVQEVLPNNGGTKSYPNGRVVSGPPGTFNFYSDKIVW